MDKNTVSGESSPGYSFIEKSFAGYFPKYGSAYPNGDVTGLGNRISEPRITLSGRNISYGDIKAYPEATNLGRLVGSKTVASIATVTNTTNELPLPFKSTSKAAANPDIFSAFGSWVSGAEKTISDVTGIGRMQTPTTGQIIEMGKNPLFAATNPPISFALQVPVLQDYAASFIHGETVTAKEKPGEFALNYAVAYLGGIAWKGAEVGLGASRASFAEKAISQGGVWRAAEQFTANVLPASGKVLIAAYGVNVYERATAGGSDFSPAAAERAGGIFIGETLPGGIGFTRGYKVPSTIYKESLLSNIGYKASLQEGTTTGRADYYVKKPLVSTYERMSLPLTRARLELPQFIEEAGGSRIVGVTKYAGYKIGTESPITPEVTRNYYPYEGIEKVAYPTISKPTPTEIFRNYFPYEGIERVAYPKGKGVDISSLVQSKAINIHSKVWPYYQAAKTPGITIKSALQERGKFDTTNLFRPSAEIARINKMSSFRYPEGVRPEGTPKVKPMTQIGVSPTTRMITGEQSPITHPGVVTRSKGGSLISKMESPSITKMAEPISAITQSRNGLPIWPSGPSPIRRQQYFVEEETQYYRLPPGMVSPGPKQETRQEIFAMPTIPPMGGVYQMQIKPAMRMGSVMQNKDSVILPVFSVKNAVGSGFDQSLARDIVSRNMQELTTSQALDITSVSKQRIMQRQKQITLQEMQPRYEIPQQYKQSRLVIPPFGGGFGGGGGGNGGGYLSGTSWINLHPVGADILPESKWSLPDFGTGFTKKMKPFKLNFGRGFRL
jgi:hypothetical protein